MGCRRSAGPTAFWSGPGDHLPDLQLVPPVLPGARVLCIGLHDVDHVAEGSFRDQEMPDHPTSLPGGRRGWRWGATRVRPDAARLLQPGDVVEVEVDRPGVLRTPVAGNDGRLRAAVPWT